MDKENFHQAVEEWIKYCQTSEVRFSSSSGSVLNCEAYKQIVSMGYETLPLIRQLYDKDSSDNEGLSIVQGHGLVSIIREIVGDDFSIPTEIKGKISEMEDYSKRWLDENISKYL